MAGKNPPGDRVWDLYTDGNVVVGRFPDEMPMEGESFRAVNERWAGLVRRDHVTAHVAIIEAEDSMGFDVLDEAQKAARMGADHGLRRWAIVADGIKRLAVKNRVDVPGMEVLATDDREAAMAWAREA